MAWHSNERTGLLLDGRLGRDLDLNVARGAPCLWCFMLSSCFQCFCWLYVYVSSLFAYLLLLFLVRCMGSTYGSGRRPKLVRTIFCIINGGNILHTLPRYIIGHNLHYVLLCDIALRDIVVDLLVYRATTTLSPMPAQKLNGCRFNN